MDVDPHVLLGSSSSKVAAVVSELRHARVGALQELELSSALASRVASLKALQKRLAATHGTMVWLLLARCIGVLTLTADDLRATDISRHRPGQHAARAVALQQQVHELRQLSVRLRPGQQVACRGRVQNVW